MHTQDSEVLNTVIVFHSCVSFFDRISPTQHQLMGYQITGRNSFSDVHIFHFVTNTCHRLLLMSHKC